jgi:hypothetical protein
MRELILLLPLCVVILGINKPILAQELGAISSDVSPVSPIITYDKDKLGLQIDTQNCSESFSDKDIIAALLGAKRQYPGVKYIEVQGKFNNKEILKFMNADIGKQWLCHLEQLTLTSVVLDNDSITQLAELLENLKNLNSLRLSGSYKTAERKIYSSGLHEFGLVLNQKNFLNFSCELQQVDGFAPLVQNKLESYRQYHTQLGNSNKSVAEDSVDNLQFQLEL